MALTVIETPVLVAVVGVTQFALDVKTQVITSLFARVVLVNVVLFVPTFAPFTFHW